jgi:hypothetical protein
VNKHWVTLLLSLLGTTTAETHEIRMVSLDCITEIVSKGMKSEEKLEILKFIGVFDIVKALCESLFPSSKFGDDDFQHAFAEGLSKLINAIGVALVDSWVRSCIFK